VEFPPDKEDGPIDHAAMLKSMGISETPHGAHAARHAAKHRTRSIDYAVVLTGEIDMLLDDSEVHLKPGDVVIQQGTNHAWSNRGDAPCLMAFVLIGANRP
jgi:uncharacterized cupin superfamily protein